MVILNKTIQICQTNDFKKINNSLVSLRVWTNGNWDEHRGWPIVEQSEENSECGKHTFFGILLFLPVSS